MDPRAARGADAGGDGGALPYDGFPRGSVVLQLDLLDLTPPNAARTHRRQQQREARPMGHSGGDDSLGAGAGSSGGGGPHTAMPLPLERLLSSIAAQPRPAARLAAQRAAAARGGGGGGRWVAPDGVAVERDGSPDGWRPQPVSLGRHQTELDSQQQQQQQHRRDQQQRQQQRQQPQDQQPHPQQHPQQQQQLQLGLEVAAPDAEVAARTDLAPRRPRLASLLFGSISGGEECSFSILESILPPQPPALPQRQPQQEPRLASGPQPPAPPQPLSTPQLRPPQPQRRPINQATDGAAVGVAMQNPAVGVSEHTQCSGSGVGRDSSRCAAAVAAAADNDGDDPSGVQSGNGEVCGEPGCGDGEQAAGWQRQHTPLQLSASQLSGESAGGGGALPRPRAGFGALSALARRLGQRRRALRSRFLDDRPPGRLPGFRDEVPLLARSLTHGSCGGEAGVRPDNNGGLGHRSLAAPQQPAGAAAPRQLMQVGCRQQQQPELAQLQVQVQQQERAVASAAAGLGSGGGALAVADAAAAPVAAAVAAHDAVGGLQAMAAKDREQEQPQQLQQQQLQQQQLQQVLQMRGRPGRRESITGTAASGTSTGAQPSTGAATTGWGPPAADEADSTGRLSTRRQSLLDDDYLDQLWRALRWRHSTAAALPAAPARSQSDARGQYGRAAVHESCEEQLLLEALRSLSEEYGCTAGGGGAAAAAAGGAGAESGTRAGSGSGAKESAAGSQSRLRWPAGGGHGGLEEAGSSRRRRRRLGEASTHRQEPGEQALAPEGTAAAAICSDQKAQLTSYSSTMYSRVVSSSVDSRAADVAAAVAAAAVAAAVEAAGSDDLCGRQRAAVAAAASRRQRGSRWWRPTVSSGCYYEALMSGEVVYGARGRDVYDRRGPGARGSAHGSSWIASDAVAPAAEGDDTTAGAASLGCLVGYLSDVDDGGDGDATPPYNPMLLRRTASSEIRRASILSAAAAAASSPWQQHAESGGGGGAMDAATTARYDERGGGAVQPAETPRPRVVDDAPGSPAPPQQEPPLPPPPSPPPPSPAAVMDSADDSGAASPFTALTAAALTSVEPPAATGRPAVAAAMIGPGSGTGFGSEPRSGAFLHPVAFVPPTSSVARVSMTVHGLPAAWAALAAAPPPPSPAGGGNGTYTDWGSGHAVCTAAAPVTGALATASGSRDAADGGGGGTDDVKVPLPYQPGDYGDGAASGGGGGANDVEVAVRSSGRYLPVEWSWCINTGGGGGGASGQAGASTAGVPGEAAAAEAAEAAEADVAALELSVAGVLGQGLIVVEVWFRGELYASLPAVYSYDIRLVLELGGQPPSERPRRGVTQPLLSGGGGGGRGGGGGGRGGTGGGVSRRPAQPLPEDVLYDLGTWLQYTAHVPPPQPSRDPSPPAQEGPDEPSPVLPPPPLVQQQQQPSELPLPYLPGDYGDGAASAVTAAAAAAQSLPLNVAPPLRDAVLQHRRTSAGEAPPRHLDSAVAIHGGGAGGGGGAAPPPPPLQRQQSRNAHTPPSRHPATVSRHPSSAHRLTAAAATAASRSAAVSVEAAIDGPSTLSYNSPEIPTTLLPSVSYTNAVESYTNAVEPWSEMRGVNLFSSAVLPGNTEAGSSAAAAAAGISHGLSSISHAALSSAVYPAAAAAPVTYVAAEHGGMPPPLPRPPSEHLSPAAGAAAARGGGRMSPVALRIEAAAPSFLSVSSSLTAGSLTSLTAGSAAAAVAAAVASHLRAFQDSAVDITVPILPGSLDLASAVSELQRRPEYGQRMQDMAIGLLAWLCQAGRPVAGGAVLGGLVWHRALRFTDVCAEVRRLAEYDGMSLLHLAVQSGSRGMLAAVAEWAATHGSALAWDELCAVGVAPVHQAAALVVATRGSPHDVSGTGAAGDGCAEVDDAGLETLTWLLRRFPTVRYMWSTARDAYGSTPGSVLSYQLAALAPDAADRVRAALVPLVGVQELWAAPPPPPPPPLPSQAAGPLGALGSTRGRAAAATAGDGQRDSVWVQLAAALTRWVTPAAAGTDESTAAGVALLALAVFWLLCCVLGAA